MDAQKLAIPKSGTTILAIKYKDGVVMAGDRRMTYGHFHYDEYSKVEDMGNLTLMACAGSVPAIQHLLQDFITEREFWESWIEKPIYIDGQSELLRKLLYGKFFREVTRTGSVALPIMAGFDPNKKCGRLFLFDVLGGIYERNNYIAQGSGSIIAEPALKRLWQPNMDLAAVRRLAIDAILQASFDIHSSPPQLAPASVFSATASGVVCMSDEEALGVAWSLASEEAKRLSGEGGNNG